MANKFKKAVEAIPDIKDGFRFGVQALGGMSYLVTSSTPRLFDGSVDIDACTKDLYPNDARKVFQMFADIFLVVMFETAETTGVKQD